MDPNLVQMILGVSTILFGSGGLAAWLHQRKSRRSGMPADEGEARQVVPQSEWLTKQVDSFLVDLRREQAEMRKRLDKQDDRIAHQERERELDAEHIDALEQHIWLQKPPPPPARTRNQRRSAE